MKKSGMKLMLFAAIIFITANLTAQHSLEKIWQTDSTLKVPESVLYDAEARVLYVANIDGSPMEKDGNGSIAKVGLDGKIINNDWITGLDAPKGMGLYKNLLYVANITEVVVIDIDKTSIVQRIPVEGSACLNDVTVDSEGIVWYVKDNGSKEVLPDTRDQGMNSADIGYDSENRILYIPTFYRNSVFAYQLK